MFIRHKNSMLQPSADNKHIHVSTNMPNSSSLVNLHGSKEALQEMLVIKENFWIQKLKTLVPFGLNQELSK